MNLILIFLGASFWCFGFHVVAKKVIYEEILGGDLEKDWDNMPRYYKLIAKPIWACMYCMASIHGTIIYFALLNTGLLYWPIFCICLCGFNYLLSQFINE